MGRDQLRLIVFLIELPEPLPFADGSTLTFELDEEVGGLGDAIAVPTRERMDLAFEPGRSFVSFRFHRVAPRVGVVTGMGPVREAIRKAFPASLHGGEASFDDISSAEAVSEPDVDGYSTVVEAVTPARLDEADAVSEAFDRCFEQLVDLVRVYRVAYESAAHHHLTIEQLQDVVVYATRSVFGQPEWDDRPSLMLLEPRLDAAAMDPIAPEQLDRLAGWIWSLRHGHPLVAYAERSADARVALYVDGDYGEAVVQSQISAEILLDAVLTFLLWEEGAVPETVAAEIFSSALARRVRSEYASRLGGDWNTRGSGSVGTWFSRVAYVRNEVVHAGYRPSRQEAEDGLAATAALDEFIRVRLADRRGTYPRTTLLVLGRPGLERMDLWRGEIERFAARADEESDWIAAYGQWRERLTAARR